jgi:nucleotide-binding universal stress UspA family protein
MFHKIIFPVDLAHTDSLEKALTVAADLSKQYGAPIVALGVTATTPGAVAHTPQEYAEKLAAYAKEAGARTGASITQKVVTAADPSIDIDNRIMAEARELEADLVVMASHVPGMAERLFASRSGYLAAHADISVFVVR